MTSSGLSSMSMVSKPTNSASFSMQPPTWPAPHITSSGRGMNTSINTLTWPPQVMPVSDDGDVRS